MIQKFFTALYADDNALNFNQSSGDLIFFGNEMGILIVDLKIRSDQILRSFLQSNMHKKYIIFGTFWNRSLCVKTWYSSKIFVNMPSFWHKKLFTKTWYKLIIWGIMSRNIYYKIFKAIHHRKTWYNLKLVLSNFLRVFFQYICYKIFKTI